MKLAYFIIILLVKLEKVDTQYEWKRLIQRINVGLKTINVYLINRTQLIKQVWVITIYKFIEKQYEDETIAVKEQNK